MFGSAEDEDLDFSPTAGPKLASLFDNEKTFNKGNASLTYTAPKQPKPNHLRNDSSSSPKKSVLANNSSTNMSNKLSLIVMKVVTSFKLEDGNYNPQGKLGFALLGNPVTKLFQLLLYKGKQQQVTSVRITQHFQFTVQPHLYATFYDDSTKNWSIMFESKDDAIEFAAQIAAARYRSANEECVIYQELLPGIGNGFEEGESVTLRLNAQPLVVDSVQMVNLKSPMIECVMAHKVANSGWASGIVGATNGSIRAIIVPMSTEVSWLKSKRTEPLFIEANVSSVGTNDDDCIADQTSNDFKTKSNIAVASKPENALDSSNEDSSVRSKGASIKEALTSSPKANKASIISRMARMGQATLPLKGAVVSHPSDSEETEEDFHPSGITKPPLHTRPGKTRSVSSAFRQQPSSSPPQPLSEFGAPAATAVIQAPAHWNQHQQNRAGTENSVFQILTSEGQLVSLNSKQQLPLVATSNAVLSPSDSTPQMSMFLSEARLQNTEMRMHLSKFSDKMDQLMAKVDNLHATSGSSVVSNSSRVGLEPNVLLASIEKIVQDNQSLQAEVAEKNKRLDEQNERIFSLLNTNSKFLEQSSSLFEQKRYQEKQQLKHNQEQVEHQQDLQLIQQMKEEKTALVNQLASLQNQLTTLQELVQALQKSNFELNQELQVSRSLLQVKESDILKIGQEQQIKTVDNQILQLSQALEKQEELNVLLQDQINVNHIKMEKDQREAKDSYEALEKQCRNEIFQLKNQLTDQANHYDSLIDVLQTKCDKLKEKLEIQPTETTVEVQTAALSLLVPDVKLFMNSLYKGLNQQFIPNKQYVGAEVRAIISSIVKKEALSFVGKIENENMPRQGFLDGHINKETSESEQSSTVTDSIDVEKHVSKSRVVSDNFASTVRKSEKFDPQSAGFSEPRESKEIGLLQNIEGLVESTEMKKDQSSSCEGSWRPLPPPPPLFHDEDDSDDWLP